MCQFTPVSVWKVTTGDTTHVTRGKLQKLDKRVVSTLSSPTALGLPLRAMGGAWASALIPLSGLPRQGQPQLSSGTDVAPSPPPSREMPVSRTTESLQAEHKWHRPV